MKTSGYQKFLAFIGVIATIGALLLMLVGGVAAALSNNAEFTSKLAETVKNQWLDLQVQMNQSGIIAVGLAVVVIGIVYLLYGICMLRASKNAENSVGAFIFAMLGLILAGTALVGAIRSGTGILGSIGSLVLNLLIFFNVLAVRKQIS